jgi:hypothetical protein
VQTGQRFEDSPASWRISSAMRVAIREHQIHRFPGDDGQVALQGGRADGCVSLLSYQDLDGPAYADVIVDDQNIGHTVGLAPRL